MSVSKTRLWSAAILTFLLAIGIVLAFLPYFSASAQMQEFCAGLPAGSSVEQVQSRAEVLDYEVSSLVEARFTVHDPRSFGRLQCRVRFTNGQLAGGEFFTGD